MVADGPSSKSGAGASARNKKIALNFVDALRNGDRAAIEAALSPNFRFLRLNDRLSRFEYLDALERTIFSTTEPVFDILYIAAIGDRVFLEVALEFDFEGGRVRGQHNSIYVIEDGEIYEIREYGGILD